MIDVSRFRDGMSRLGGAVNVITTDGPAGRAGFTATAVCSVTDTPPTLLVCQNRTSWTHKFFAENRVLCVNLLAAGQEEVSGLFASRDVGQEERFARIGHDVLETGSPALRGALVNFDCEIESVQQVGTHDVFFCRVVAMRVAEGGDGLVWFDRGYHRLPAHGKAVA